MLFESRRGKGDVWSAPTRVSFSDTPFEDFDPFISHDGKQFFFSSHRPIDGGTTPNPTWDIWVSKRTAGGWGAPVRLGPEINSASSEELYPTTTWDGALYFNSDRPGGHGTFDLYRAPRAGTGYASPANLGPEINTEHLEFNPMPSRTAGSSYSARSAVPTTSEGTRRGFRRTTSDRASTRPRASSTRPSPGRAAA